MEEGEALPEQPTHRKQIPSPPLYHHVQAAASVSDLSGFLLSVICVQSIFCPEINAE